VLEQEAVVLEQAAVPLEQEAVVLEQQLELVVALKLAHSCKYSQAMI